MKLGLDSSHLTQRRQGGAALLLAMLILTLVATLAASMVWAQHRAIEVESAERARAQAQWILNGALDWARLILREDARNRGPDHLGEPWAVPLAEARLSTFLAADRDNNAEGGPEAFLSGYINDAQAKYNLRNLAQAEPKLLALEAKALGQLCTALGLPQQVASTLAAALPAAMGDAADDAQTIAPQTMAQLRWLGLDAATIDRLATAVEILPAPTPVNLNTASREVIAAVVEGLDLGSADRLIQARQRKPFDSLDEAKAHLPGGLQFDPRRVDIRSRYFEIGGRLRLEQRVLEERSLVERRDAEVIAIHRERSSRYIETR